MGDGVRVGLKAKTEMVLGRGDILDKVGVRVTGWE